MRNILNIFKKDLKDIFTNYAMLIVVVALCILPSLYAWFNIKASWDPYGSTSNISVAIVNNDKGTTVRDKEINIGDELVKNLKDNSDLGWKFVNKDNGLKGVKDGKYYASIEIPANFSKDLTSLISSDVKKGELIYSVNEKINAIAPKITDKGASTIQLQINQTVVETVSQVLFEVSNELGIELEGQIPKLNDVENSLVEVQGKFGDLNETINLASNGVVKATDLVKDIQKDLPLIKNTINQAQGLSADVQKFLKSSQDSINKVAPIIKNDIGLMNDISNSIMDTANALNNAIKNGSDDAIMLIDNLSSKLHNLATINNSVLEFLTKLNNLTQNHPLSDTINRLKDLDSKLTQGMNSLSSIKSQIQSGQTPADDVLGNVLKIGSDIQSITSSLYNNFDGKVSGPINDIFEKGYSVSDDVIKTLQEAENKLPQAEDILNTTLKLSDKGLEGINYAKEKLPKVESMVNELTDAVKKVNDEENLNDLVKLLKNDIVSKKNFLKEPVTVKENKLYPIENYGSAMTPFYTVLSLWVGLLLLSSLLSAEVHGNYKSYEVYFGRGLTFVLIAIVQALIVSLGDIYVLGVKPVDPVLLVLGSVFTSIVFTAIVYSLLSVFGNMGKAMGIILLVIQVAGSGGTFPIEVTPKFFQMVNPYLPFTYSISMLRESVGGVYTPVLYRDLAILTFYIAISLIIALPLKKPINKIYHKFNEKFSESGLSEH
ncbi:yhgE/Pip N-terminal domain protein [[Clostridium] bifermentans ATCC 638]|uniref:YhgE/Pip N-terminal domain protein n=3 Tax=Paraclostridium TaxID=1849822 RepID=T4VMN4_PARBF|nr:YhgE/Pip domain-containing protein [Paraclostridium bifermentans]EQK42390.1 yhgE/Pip N-terminal domain protein [[Clostridium] bifermentans ATCC 638] [Paraclostridium bifermentans ATCC 638 = DSM 14991]RIZ59911.1 YhgE/Pip domain-containing protein [Paraclostridium bifermentans]UAG19232.1 YhgE/Pip domain-containing protein [Paraclostridium bifermentans]